MNAARRPPGCGLCLVSVLFLLGCARLTQALTTIYTGGSQLACSANQDTYDFDIFLDPSTATRLASFSQLRLEITFPTALQAVNSSQSASEVVSAVIWNGVKPTYTAQYSDGLRVSTTMSSSLFQASSNRLSIQTLKRLGAPFSAGTYEGWIRVFSTVGNQLDSGTFTLPFTQNILLVQKVAITTDKGIYNNNKLAGSSTGCLDLTLASNCDYIPAEASLKLTATAFYTNWTDNDYSSGFGASLFSNPTGLRSRIFDLKSSSSETMSYDELKDGISVRSVGKTLFKAFGPSTANLMVCNVWTQPFVGQFCDFKLGLHTSVDTSSVPFAKTNTCLGTSTAAGLRSVSILSPTEWTIFSTYNLSVGFVSGIAIKPAFKVRVRFLNDIFEDDGSLFDPKDIQMSVLDAQSTPLYPEGMTVTKDATGAQVLTFKNVSFVPRLDTLGVSKTTFLLTVSNIKAPNRPISFEDTRKVVQLQVWDDASRLYLDSAGDTLTSTPLKRVLAFEPIQGGTVFSPVVLTRGLSFTREVCLSIPSKIGFSQPLKLTGLLPHGLGPQISIIMGRGFHPDSRVDLQRTDNSELTFEVVRDLQHLFESDAGVSLPESHQACLNVTGKISPDVLSIGRMTLNLTTTDAIELMSDFSENWAEFQPAKLEIRRAELTPSDDTDQVGNYHMTLGLSMAEVPPTSLTLRVEFTQEYLSFSKDLPAAFFGCAEVNADRQGQVVCTQGQTRDNSRVLALSNIRFADEFASSASEAHNDSLGKEYSAEVKIFGLKPSSDLWVAWAYNVLVTPEGQLWAPVTTSLSLPVGCPPHCRQCSLHDRSVCLQCLEGYELSSWTFRCDLTIEEHKYSKRIRVLLIIAGSTSLLVCFIYLAYTLRSQSGQQINDYLDNSSKDYLLIFTDMKVLTSFFGTLLTVGYLYLSIHARNTMMIVASSLSLGMVFIINLVWSAILMKNSAKISVGLRVYLAAIHSSGVLILIRRLGDLRAVEYLQGVYLNEHLNKQLNLQVDQKLSRQNAEPAAEADLQHSLNGSNLDAGSQSSQNLLPGSATVTSFSSSVLELQHLAYQSGIVPSEARKKDACSIKYTLYNKIRTSNMHARLSFLLVMTILAFLTLTALLRAELYFEIMVFGLIEWAAYTLKLNRVKSKRKLAVQQAQVGESSTHGTSSAILPNYEVYSVPQQNLEVSYVIPDSESPAEESKPEELMHKSPLKVPKSLRRSLPGLPESAKPKPIQLQVSEPRQTQLSIGNWDSLRPAPQADQQAQEFDDPEMY